MEGNIRYLRYLQGNIGIYVTWKVTYDIYLRYVQSDVQYLRYLQGNIVIYVTWKVTYDFYLRYVQIDYNIYVTCKVT